MSSPSFRSRRFGSGGPTGPIPILRRSPAGSCAFMVVPHAGHWPSPSAPRPRIRADGGRVDKPAGRRQEAARCGKAGQPGRRHLTFSILRPLSATAKSCLGNRRREGCPGCVGLTGWARACRPPRCQRAVKTSQVGEMKSSHFERSELRRRGSSTSSLLTETFYGARTQNGDCRLDFSVTSVTLVSQADRTPPGHRPRHGGKVPQAGEIRPKTSHFARRVGRVKTSHLPPRLGIKRSVPP